MRNLKVDLHWQTKCLKLAYLNNQTAFSQFSIRKIRFFFLILGLTFSGIKDGVADWSGCGNIKLVIFENAEKFQNYIESFNVNTNHWVAEYVFKRLKFMGNRNISHGATLLFLAVWHGFHSGYYMCFLMEFIVIHFEKEVSSGRRTFFFNDCSMVFDGFDLI